MKLMPPVSDELEVKAAIEELTFELRKFSELWRLALRRTEAIAAKKKTERELLEYMKRRTYAGARR